MNEIKLYQLINKHLIDFCNIDFYSYLKYMLVSLKLSILK